MRLQLIRVSTLAAGVCAALPHAAGAQEDGGESGWEAGADVLVYTDTDNVQVASPQVSVHRRLDNDGGDVSARVTVDAISAASVDVVSQATQRFSETRTELNLAASKAFGRQLPAISYRFSNEPDYVSHGGRIGFQHQLAHKDTTVAGGYGLTRDRVGRSGTPSAVFSERLLSHAADLSLTQNLGTETVGRLVYTLTVQSGYMEKPYRSVPIFDPARLAEADSQGIKLDLDNFDDFRLDAKPPESVPDLRVRHAIAARILRYVAPWNAAIRADYQLYVDSWGVVANIFEPSLAWQIHEQVRGTGYLRLYHQSSADFWERTYTTDDAGAIPHFRTVDRGLTSYVTGTAGARGEWHRESLGAYLEIAAMQTWFSDYLFLDSRFALLSQAGFRWSP